MLLLLLAPGCLELDFFKDSEVPTSTNPTVIEDSDGDGLSDSDEVAIWGTDPENPDTDGDLLSDGDEVKLGTDPLDSDSDGDGYPDGAEAAEGSDPLDATSGIYTGGWPYNPDKDAIDPGPFDGENVVEGDIFPRFTGQDQYGDEVDLYDFAGHGKLVVVDGTAAWCEPCRTVSAWLVDEENPEYLEDYTAARTMVNNGDVYWLTVVTDGEYGEQPAPTSDVQSWFQDYPNPAIPVLNNPGFEVFEAINNNQYFPRQVVLDETMTVLHVSIIQGTLEFIEEEG